MNQTEVCAGFPDAEEAAVDDCEEVAVVLAAVAAGAEPAFLGGLTLRLAKQVRST